MAQTVKSPPAMQETWVQSLDWDDPLEEGMATPSSIFVWRIPMDRGAWWVTLHGVAKSQTRLSDQAHAQGVIQIRIPRWLSGKESSHQAGSVGLIPGLEINQSILREINPDCHWKDWYWIWSSSALATSYEEMTYWKRPWCWGKLKAKGEGGSRG